jgi:outer membrane protein OmpA-like peptidoglycan-associated protein
MSRSAVDCALFVSLLAGAPCASPDEPAGLKFKVLDLVYTVKDIGGKVLDLKVKETDTELRLELAADVLFDFDEADILPKAQNALDQVAGLLRQKAKGAVRIEGHTDGKGSAAYNHKLSARRADAVKNWLAKQAGLERIRFTTAGYGATRPVAPNTKPDGSDDPDGRQKNRRVELIVKK